MLTENPPTDRRRTVDPASYNRSRIANGSLGIDLRTAAGRRWRDVYTDAVRRTGGCNETLCRSLASLTVKQDAMDAALADGDPVDVEMLVKVAGAISRLATKLGIVTAEPVVPDDAPSWVIRP